MTTRTSKSASATKKISLPSGTSAQMVATAGTKPKRRRSQFDVIADRIEQTSVDEFRAKLVKLGIITKTGRLTKKYQPPAKNKKAAKKSLTAIAKKK